MKNLPPVLLLAAALSFSPLFACSFSASSESFSNSSKSSSDSSSGSSRSATARYQQDVSDYTVAFVKAGGSDTPGTFMTGVGDLARKRGISDWEASEATWEGIGRGLGKAKVSGAQLAAYKQSWGLGNPTRIASIQKGYDATR